jgi:hypothetical protein
MSESRLEASGCARTGELAINCSWARRGGVSGGLGERMVSGESASRGREKVGVRAFLGKNQGRQREQRPPRPGRPISAAKAPPPTFTCSPDLIPKAACSVP